MATRHQARQAVVALLYADGFCEQSWVGVCEFFDSKRLRNEQRAFAERLYMGVREHLTALDAYIQPFIKENDKVSSVERAILRLSAYEFLHSTTPKAVIINEAIEISKEFSSENAPKFINAVLDKLKDSDFKGLCDGKSGVNLNENEGEKSENLNKKIDEKSENNVNLAKNDGENVNLAKNKAQKADEKSVNLIKNAIEKSVNFSQKATKNSQNQSTKSVNFSKNDGENLSKKSQTKPISNAKSQTTRVKSKTKTKPTAKQNLKPPKSQTRPKNSQNFRLN